MWGANAINGVINIITKIRRDTKGGLVTAGAGSKETAAGLVQYGGDIGSKGTYRAFGQYTNVDNSTFSGGQGAADGWHAWHSGFRSDWSLSPRDTLMVSGDFLTSADGGHHDGNLPGGSAPSSRCQPPPDQHLRKCAGALDHTLANGSAISLQFYYNGLQRDGEAGANASNDTADLEFKHHLAAGTRNDIVWGLGYRLTTDQIRRQQVTLFYQSSPSRRQPL